MDVVALPREEPMRPDRDFDERVAGAARAEAGTALAAQPQHLAFLDAGRNLHVEGAALGQVEPHGAAVDGIEEIDRQAIADVGPARIGARMRLLAQELGEDVVGFGEVREARGAGVAAAFALGREVAIEALARPLGAARVDLAVVVALPLVLVGEDVVGARHLLEARLGFLVPRIEIGMKLLGEAAVGLADVLERGGAIDAENFVGVCHRVPVSCRSRKRAIGLNRPTIENY